MVQVTTLPHDDSPNGWNLILPARRPRPTLQGDQRVKWAVVGAGFAGLAAARRLAENQPDASIALVDAQEVALGTSGRNTGIAMDVPYNSGTAPLGKANRERHIRLNRAAIDYLEGLIQRNGINCQWSRRGKYHAAITEKGKENGIRPVANELDALGERFTWLTRSELAQRIGTSYFLSAIYIPGSVLLNPAALVRGLADSLPENVALYENSPVIDFDYRSNVRLKTPQGSLLADNTILATNGFIREFGFCRGKLLMFAIYASLTGQLSEADLNQMGSDRDWGLTPANVNGGAAMRFTQDGRFLLRERVIYAPNFARSDINLTDVAQRHQTLLQRRFPNLSSLAVQYTWVGVDSMTSNRSHAFGCAAPNVYLAVCQNGVGITKGTMSGILAADLATGRGNPLIADIVGLGAPARLPPRPLLDLGIKTQFLWDRLRNHTEWQ